jgi:hypothetical protein
MFYFFVFILIASLSFSCNAEQKTMEIIDSTDSLSIVMNEWKDWAESSADGLWENDSSHMVTLDLLHVYGGPEEVDPPFFYPEAFTVQGDTFFVSDGGAQKLVVFNSQGEILWSTEGPGEGPGLFSGVSQLDVVGDIISVSNLGNSRIDLFSTSGEWLKSIRILSAYDIQFLNDSLMVVVKQTSPEGCVMLLSCDGDTLTSFGRWEEHLGGWGSNRDLHCAVLNSKLLVLTSYYSARIEIYDIAAESLLVDFSRTLPVEIPKPENDNGIVTFNTVILDVFIGPEGMINVLLRPFSPKKTLDLQNEGIADYSVVDRFNILGQYLDSYVIPAPASIATYNDGKLFVGSENECAIFTYKISTGD